MTQSAALVPALRADVWLWHARVLSSRAACARLVALQGVRINGRQTLKPDARVRPGDVLTFSVGARVRVLKVVALGRRRGPAPEAARLYADLASPAS